MVVEDKELGLKIATNEEEAFWTRTKENAQKEIENNLRINMMNQKIIELCDEKLLEK
jgi:hypothetical protein